MARSGQDLASYGIVRVLDGRPDETDLRWEPEAAFSALADFHR